MRHRFVLRRRYLPVTAVGHGSPRSVSLFAALIALALAATVWSLSGSPSFRTSAPGSGAMNRLSMLPLSAQSVLSRALAQGDERFTPRRSGVGFKLAPAGGVAASFTSRGVRLAAPGGTVSLWLSAVGRAGRLSEVRSVMPQRRGTQVVYSRGGLSESYDAGPLGLEQGFTLAHRPAGRAPVTVAVGYSGALRVGYSGALAVGYSGALRPRPVPRSGALLFRSESGVATLRYGGLEATDAEGRRLRATLGIQGDRILIRVDDRGAVYPLKIDPLVQAAQLTASDGAGGDNFGYSLALSGGTLVVGAYSAGPSQTYQGAAYVFTEGAHGWQNMTETAKLTPSDGSAEDEFGYSVAIQGSTIVVGAPQPSAPYVRGPGKAYVFIEPSGGWHGNVPQSAVLTPSDGHFNDQLGTSAAISGINVFVGAPNHYVGGNTNENGEVYVFTEPVGGWKGTRVQNATLNTESDGGGAEGVGRTIAASGDTVAAGAPGATSGSTVNGAVYVFTKPADGWTGPIEAQARLTAINASNDQLGWSLAFSGGTLVAGGAGLNASDTGGAWVFNEPAGGWTGSVTQSATLQAAGGAHIGYSVALAGNQIVAGAANAAYLFLEPAGGWTGTVTSEASASGSEGLGQSVALQPYTIIAGAPTATATGQGAVYVFTRQATRTRLSASSTSKPVGSDVTFLATVSPNPQAGTITFTDGGKPIAGCSAVKLSSSQAAAHCSTSFPRAGQHTITARYSGTQGYLPSLSNAVTVRVS